MYTAVERKTAVFPESYLEAKLQFSFRAQYFHSELSIKVKRYRILSLVLREVI
jgi:hypothetical protein